MTRVGAATLSPVFGVIIWLGIWAAFTLSFWVDKQLLGTPEPIGVTAWSAGGIWLVYGTLAIPCLMLFRRLAGASANSLRVTAALVVSAAAFHVAAQLLFVGLERWVAYPVLELGEHPSREYLIGYTARRAALSTLAFGGIIGLVTGRDALVARAHATRRAAELEAAVTSARLDALRAQLQPHFLFNALNAVASAIRADPHVAEGMLERLARLLRASLASGSVPTIPLRDELTLARTYLELQAARFSDRLHFRIDCPSELDSTPVPPLLLQPLIENAVRHGIEPSNAGGTVSVSARRTQEGLELEVADDGIGPTAAPSASGGIGLTNVRLRLTTLYGDRATLTLVARAGGGTVAIVGLPVSSPGRTA